MLHQELNDDALLVRDGREIPVKVYAQSTKNVFAALDVDAQEGDLFRCKEFPEELVVSKVKRIRAPRGMGHDLNHATLVLVTTSEWAHSQRPVAGHTSQTWNIGQAGAIAGHDIHGPVNVTITGPQFFQALEKQIEDDKTIPKGEKKGILTKLRDAVFHPKVVEAATTVLSTIWKSSNG
jgi:hypothetical protein